MRKILSCLRKAVEDFNMIEENDKICVGLSGGKDSMLLLKALKNYQLFSPKKFELYAISIDVGFNNMDFAKMEEFCKELDVPLTIQKTDISKIVFDIRNESNPCSLCAKMKKGALNDLAISLGSNKLALGHHQDDFIESFMLSLLYEGRIHTFKPITYLDRKKVYVIRPFIYLKEKEVIGAVNKLNIPVVKSTCPVDGHTKREDMKLLLKKLKKEIPTADDKIFTALKNHLDKI